MGRSGRPEGTALAVVATEAAGAVPDRVRPVEMAADEDPQARAAATARLFGHLQGHARKGDDVVAADDALLLDAEDLVEVYPAQGDEGRGGVGRGPGKLGVEGGDEPLAQVAVGRAHRGDVRDAQLVDEAILQGAVDA